jgi:hypothetical protein
MAASELDNRLLMQPLRSTKRVWRNAAADRFLEKKRTLGSSIKFEHSVEEVAGVYPRNRRVLMNASRDTAP